MVSRNGQPDNCTYCDDPEMASARWRWPDGTSLSIGGGMLSEFTKEGESARQAWLKRGDSEEAAGTGNETSDEAGFAGPGRRVRKKKRTESAPEPASTSTPRASVWNRAYGHAKGTVKRWFGW